MQIIPGKYIGRDGGEYTVLMLASDGETGEKTVIYRRGDSGAFFTLPAAAWKKSFVPEEELALSENSDASEAELARRFTELFAGRPEVCSVHWRGILGNEGHNYLCENYNLVDGCMRGTDGCKNCRSGRLTPFSEAVARRHLGGDELIGVYPVTADGCCRFLVLEAETSSQLAALAEVCRTFAVPAYAESFGRLLRLWLFFSRPMAAKSVCALGCAIITTAIERSAEVPFSLYGRMSPFPAAVSEGSFGTPVILPLGKRGRSSSVFTDEKGVPLSGGANEIFGFRTITAGYLADRLNALGNPGFGRLCGGVRQRLLPVSFPKKLTVRLGTEAVLPKRGLAPEAVAALKRLACFRSPIQPVDEFSAPTPPVTVCFRQDEKYLYLPRGAWNSVEELLKISGADFSVTDERKSAGRVHYRLSAQLSDNQEEAAAELLLRPTGILLGRTGSGKTLAIAAVIDRMKEPTLILTADEISRRRWIDNVYRLLGADAEKPAGKTAVRLITDEKIKDRYGLVILADCSRLPMNEEIFTRINGLSARAVYGITADDRRRDGLWGYINMLCGEVVCRL